MPKLEIKIKCFYCGQEFLLRVKRILHIMGYCVKCKKTHLRITSCASAYLSKRCLSPKCVEAFKKHREYVAYRNSLLKKFAPTKSEKKIKKNKPVKPKPKIISLVRRGDKLIKQVTRNHYIIEEVEIGTIKSETIENYLVIMKNSFITEWYKKKMVKVAE